MSKKDVWIIGLVLAAASILFILTRCSKPADSATVSVYVHDQLYKSVPSTAHQKIVVDQGDGKVNVVVIDEAGVHMESSTCKNQICVDTGTIDPAHTEELLLNNWIVCLPNGVTVEVKSGAEGVS